MTNDIDVAMHEISKLRDEIAEIKRVIRDQHRTVEVLTDLIQQNATAIQAVSFRMDQLRI